MADLFEEALVSIGAAIADVREKVVEEGWFGRSLGDNNAVAAPDGQEQAAFGSLTSTVIGPEPDSFKEALATISQGSTDAEPPSQAIER